MNNWIEKLPHRLTIVPINEISFPGSHDSLTYSISSSSKVAPDADAYIKELVRWFGHLATSIIAKWARAQRLNVNQQLCCGVRYFDFRLAINTDENDTPYACHSLFGGPIELELRSVYNFLSENHKEIVMIDCNHFYGFKRSHHLKMVQKLKEIFGSMLVSYTGKMPSLLQLWELGQRVIIFYQSPEIHDPRHFWPGKSIPSPWADTDNIRSLIHFLRTNYDKHAARPYNFYVSQAILTPSLSTVLLHPSMGLRGLARKSTPYILSWLESTKAGPRGINVVIANYCADSKFCQLVVSLNTKQVDV